MNSPFFLGPQDRLGDGENYDEWGADLETALQARHKFGFLDGTITAPKTPYTQADWTAIHAILVSWIMNTVTPKLKSTLSKYKDAKKLWGTLKERFAIVNGPRIQQLNSAIARCEQSKTMTVATYYGKLTSLWEELYTHESLISCSCCSRCTASQEHEILREKDKLHEFLMGFNSEYYGQIQSSILSQDPLPSLNRAYQLLFQDERVRNISNITEEKLEVVGFSVRTGRKGRGRMERLDKSKLYCTDCKMDGHENTQCFEKVGYPDWWGDRTKSDGGTGGKTRGGNNSRQWANAMVTKWADNTVTSSTQMFTADQWKALANVFGNMTFTNDRLCGKFYDQLWIIDTSASNHVTGNLAILSNVKNTLCPVVLPDGKKVAATHEGTVKLIDNITLMNVLYVPQLNCNLISVPQLCHDLNSTIIFNSSMCAIQDQTMELIGMGSKQDGLYYFKESSLINVVKVTEDESLALWHGRMGHPSEK